MGLSSNQALQKVKKILGVKKAGHTGTLDPLATGMLPIALGEATKYCQYLLDADKTYQVTAKFGEQTTTGDSEGEVIATAPIPTAIPDLSQFLGPQSQIPPMYSALKHQGKPLYQLARAGKIIERPPRAVTVHQIKSDAITLPELKFTVTVSKGTYIRVLVEDIAKMLGSCAHVAQLRRLSVGSFKSDDMVALDNSQSAKILPIQAALVHLPVVTVTDPQALALQQGRVIFLSNQQITGVMCCVRASDGGFLGIGEGLSTGEIKPRRLLSGELGARITAC